MKGRIQRRFSGILTICLIGALLALPVRVMAAEEPSTPFGTDNALGDKTVEINGAGQNFDVSADGKTLTYEGGTVWIELDGTTVPFFEDGIAASQINVISRKYFLAAVGNQITVYVKANSNYEPSVRAGGADLTLQDAADGVKKVVYDGSNGAFFSINFANSNPTDPSGPSEPSQAPDNAISIELWDNLGNMVSYSDYSATQAPGPGRPVIGAKVEYSYDQSDWHELSNAGTDPLLSYADQRYVFAVSVPTVYIRVAKVDHGFLSSKKLEGYDDGHKVWENPVTNMKVYTLTNPGVCDLIFDNGSRNIIWSYDPNAEEENRVTHGKVEIVSAVDGAGTNVLNQSAPYGQGAEGGFLEIPADALVTVKITPDYGYQFVSGSLNGNVVTAGDEVSTFTFIMPRTHLHLSALFTQTQDQVAVTAANVKSGSIAGGADVISSGNLKLTVADSDMSAVEKTQMMSSEAAAGVTLTNWLAVDLDQVVNKGNSTDMWTTELTELNNKVTITLNVGTGLDSSKKYVVVREHEGVYEQLPATYDATAGTLTFQSDKFSDYAIGTTESGNAAAGTNPATTTRVKDQVPKTGDSQTTALLLFTALASGAGIMITSKKKVAGK